MWSSYLSVSRHICLSFCLSLSVCFPFIFCDWFFLSIWFSLSLFVPNSSSRFLVGSKMVANMPELGNIGNCWDIDWGNAWKESEPCSCVRKNYQGVIPAYDPLSKLFFWFACILGFGNQQWVRQKHAKASYESWTTLLLNPTLLKDESLWSSH